MNKIKIGVIGCSDIADRLVVPAIKSLKIFELIAVASRDMEKAKRFASKFNCEYIKGYDAIVNKADIDALYISLPNSMHEEWSVQSLQKGKHVIVEKPASTSLKSTENMVKNADKNKLALFENFMFTYHSQHEYIKKIVTRGEIGEIRCFRSSFGFPKLPENNIRYNKNLGGGSLLDAGVYTIKASQLFLNKEIKVKSSFLKYDPIKEVDIYGGAFLTDGTIQGQVSFGFDNFYQCNYEIWGSKGKLTSLRAFTAGPGFKPKIILEKQDELHELILPADNHFENILKDFAKTIKDKNYDAKYEEILAQAKLVEEVRLNAQK